MKFLRVSLAEARGHVLGHNVVFEGRRLLKKGRRLLDAELDVLARTGSDGVYVAMLDAGDVDEDSAALRIARALVHASPLQAKLAHGGRVSLTAPEHGVLSLRSELLLELNLLDGVTLATLPAHAATAPGQLVGTLKVIPFALPQATVEAAEALAARGVISLRPIAPRRVSMLVSGAESRRERLFDAFRVPLVERVSRLGPHTVSAAYVALEGDPEGELAGAIADELDAGVDLLILVGETATMDSHDLGPRAIRRAGGTVDAVGAPVYPGNLLLLGHRGRSAILGAPGCVRSRAENVVDRVLPRLLLGDRLGQRDIAELGHGGLLHDSRGDDDAGATGDGGANGDG
jgi:molybdenum cofactor cytidylyltransferase